MSKHHGARRVFGRGGVLRTLLVPLLVIAACAAVLIWYSGNMAETTVANTYQELRSAANAQKTLLLTQLEREGGILRALGDLILTDGLDSSEEEQRARMQAVTDDTELTFLYLIKKDGSIVGTEGYRRASREHDYFSDSFAQYQLEYDDSGDGARFLMTIPVEKDGERLAVLVGAFDQQAMNEIFSARPLEGAGNSYLCSGDGEILINGGDKTSLFHPGRPLAQFGNLVKGLAAARALGGGTAESMGRDMLAGISGIFHISLAGETRYIVYEPLGISGWYVVNSVPGEYVENEIRNGITPTMIALLAFSICAAALMIYIAARERRSRRALTKEKDSLLLSEEQYRIAVEQSRLGVMRYDVDKDVLHLSPRAQEMFDAPESYHGLPAALINLPAMERSTHAEARRLFRDVRAGISGERYQIAFTDKTKKRRDYEVSAVLLGKSAGKPHHAILLFEDVTRLHDKERAFDKWLKELGDLSGDRAAVLEWNLTKNALVSVSGELSDYLGALPADSLGEFAMQYAQGYVGETERAAFTASLDRARLIGAYQEGESGCSLDYREYHSEGAYRWMRLLVRLMPDKEGDDLKAFVILRDVDEEKREQLRLTELSEKDPLTGALGREAFLKKLAALLKGSREDEKHALIAIDLDGFRALNDSYGRAEGDRALSEIANQLRTQQKQGDLLSRFEGDEFLLLLRDTPYEAAIEKRAQAMCDLIATAFQRKGELTASAGAAIYPQHGRDFEQLYDHAGAALTFIKREGGGQAILYQDSMRDSLEHMISPVAEKSSAQPRILVVDDNDMNRALMTEIFQEDYAVSVAKDGRAALMLMLRYGTGLSAVLLDLMMPVMGGLEVLEKMRADSRVRDIPVIVVSGESDLSASLRAVELGAADYVTKPVNPTLLRARVRATIVKAENARRRIQRGYAQLQSDEEERFRYVMMSTGTVIVEYDFSNNVFLYDPSIDEHIGGRYDGRRLWEIFGEDGVAAQDELDRMRGEVDHLAQDENHSGVSLRVKLKTNEGDLHFFTMNAYKRADENMQSGRILITFNDVNEEMLAQEKLRYQAQYDSLTGLYNRDTFIEKATALISQAEAGAYLLCVFDVDNFKVINDQYGHEKGNELLRYLARDTREALGDKGAAARLSADCFAAVYPSDMKLSEMLRREYQENMRRMGLPDTVVLSFGLYAAEDRAVPVDSMLDRAQLAKQAVKGKYGEHAAWYDENMRDRLIGEQELVQDMDRALTERQFEVFFQPQYNHRTGALCGAEALARWRHPEKGMIPPGRFVPIFEKNGFIVKLDEFIWNETARLMRKWLDADGGRVVPISVNVSRMDMFSESLIDTLEGVVAKHAIPKELFRLEITESAYTENSEQLIKTTKALRERGFYVEMDDFGSGYSSLNTLKDVPVDMIKLDMRFLSAGDDKKRSGNILNAIVRMAKWLSTDVIAEGVETREQADFLLSIGCELIQGYLYAKPQPAEEFPATLEAARQNDGGRA